MRSPVFRDRELAFAAALLVSTVTPPAVALEGGQAAAPHHFGVIGAIAASRSQIGHGFPAVQIAPHWVLTAAHVAPAKGAIFADDCGISGVAEVRTFEHRVPTQSPVPGAPRDDIALVRLSAAIHCPYYPRLAGEELLPRPPRAAGMATLVSGNPDLAHRRFGFATVEVTPPVPGFNFALALSQDVGMVSGDSGSALFVGRLTDANGDSILLGIASAESSSPNGRHLGVYTRIGAYRSLLDEAVQASGEDLNWATRNSTQP